MTIRTGISIFNASAIIAEEQTVINKDGQIIKWIEFSVQDAENVHEQCFTVFDLGLDDLILKQAALTDLKTKEIAA